MAEWLRKLIYGTLNCSLSDHPGFFSSARVTCETSQVLLVGRQVVFLGNLPFSPHLMIDSAQNESNDLDWL